MSDTLNKIRDELIVKKGRYNKFGGFSFRNLEDINEAVKPLLKEYGATLKYTDDLVFIGDRYYVKATAIYKDKDGEETATAYAREALAKKGMDDSQITGTASSYARKYAVGGLFLLDDGNDADSYEPKEPKLSKEDAEEKAREDKDLADIIDKTKQSTLKKYIAKTGTDKIKFTAYFGKDIEDFNGADYGKALKMLMEKDSGKGRTKVE